MTFSRALQNYEERIIRVYKAFQYKPYIDPNVTPVPIKNTPIDLDDVKSHLRIDWDNDTEDNYLRLLIKATVCRAESYMNINMINQQYITYRDMFDGAFELRRAPFVSLDSFKYLTTNNILTTVDPTIYQVVTDNYPFCILTPKTYYQWPMDISDQYQAIQIIFTVGYGVNKAYVPEDLKLALLEHMANAYANRGDSDVAGLNPSGFGNMSSTQAIPRIALDIYDKYKIRTLDGAISY